MPGAANCPRLVSLRDIIGLLDRFEDPVDDTAVVMHMAVERRTEAVDEAHRPEAGTCAGATAPAQMGLNDAQQDSQDGAEGLRRRQSVVSKAY